MSNLHKCACCEELTVDFFCGDCEKADCCMINGAKCGKFPMSAPDFTQHPVWMDCCGFEWSRDEYEYDKDSASQHTGPWTPLDTAEAWRDRINRDKLIDLLGNEWGDPVWVADAVLAALPELMGGAA